MDCNVYLLEGVHFQTGKPISLTVKNETILDIQPIKENKSLPMIGAGLVDLQINGYGGMDFNTLPYPNDDIIQKVTRALWKEGVTTYLPTVITNSTEKISDAMRSIARACARSYVVGEGVAGVHLEGPFISPEDGPRGAHDKKHIQPPNWELFQRWQDAAEGKIKMITLSPEWPEAISFIQKCVENGVTVSIGHTAATPEQIREAVTAGARMSTHLGNGTHLMLPRHPNYLWEQIAHDDMWASIIADGFHLSEAFMKTVLRVKGDKTILVSDAVYLSGMPPGDYDTHIGKKVVLTPRGKLHLAENTKLLAGSVQLLKDGVHYLVISGLASLAQAWEMASIRPSQFLNIPPKQGIKPGAPADIVIFNWNDDGFDILQTYKNGELVYNKKEYRK